MPTTAPTTWALLQAVQARIQSELLVTDSRVTAASPFSTLTASDQAIYGTTNAIFIGRPKNIEPSLYPRQCHLIPTEESVYRRAYGGKIWDELSVYTRFLYVEDANAYQALQDLITARDAAQVIIGKHAELPGVATVEAAKAQLSAHTNVPLGLHYETNDQGMSFACWGILWWYRQQYYVTGGIVP